MNIRLIMSSLFSICLLLACSDESKKQPLEVVTEGTSIVEELKSEGLSADEYYAKAAQVLFKHRAISASLFGIPEETAGYHFANTLEDYSPKSEQAFRSEMMELAKSLARLKVKKGTEEENQQVMIDLLEYYAGAPNNNAGFVDSWMGHSVFVLNQINGPMIDIPNNLMNSHTISSLKDAEDYIQRLNAFSQMSETILDKAREDEKAGWIAPKILITKTHNYLTSFSQGAAADAPLVQAFKKKLSSVDSISQKDKDSLVDQATLAVESKVFPAFELLAAHTEKLIDKGKQNTGVWTQPKGAEFYAYSIKRLGDTDLNAEQIHQLGLSEVQRINAEMDSILTEEGYSEGSVGERMVALNNEERFLYANNDQGRAELLSDLNQMVDDISVKMPAYFSSIPPYKVEVRRIPIATQDSSAGGYYTPPTLDGSVPGVYWINLKNTAANAKFDLKTLTYHEAVPGHHWQVALNLAQKDLPLLRRIAPYNAYVEGWALYSEQVAFEMGMYEDDPFGNLGRLKAELFRAVRLVVDTGLHHKRWSREQAIDYMASQTGSNKDDVVSEIERYMAWPGQALGYKLGMIKILELRKLAKEQLKDKFNLRAFHEVVLLGGAVPMSVLEKKVKNWIANLNG